MRLDELARWCEDDCPTHDLTTKGLHIEDVPTRVDAFAKKGTRIAGVWLARDLFTQIGAKVTLHTQDGCDLQDGDPVMTIWGSAGVIHRTYKTAQCIMEYASGIAAYTHQMLSSARLKAPQISIAGTRKMMPGSRAVAYAGLLAGGGVVHRYGLSDSILVFDQHRVLCGGQDEIDAAIRGLVSQHPERRVAVEVGNPDEAMRYATLGVGMIQCEKFSLDDLQNTVQAVLSINPSIKILAAGGITKDNAAEYASTGVDVLVSSRIYFAPPVDIKMRFSCADGTHEA